METAETEECKGVDSGWRCQIHGGGGFTLDKNPLITLCFESGSGGMLQCPEVNEKVIVPSSIIEISRGAGGERCNRLVIGEDCFLACGPVLPIG